MATPGTILSAAGHVGLFGWLILGWGLNSEPLIMDAVDVSVISGEAFDELRAARMPDPGDADPTAPVAPPVDDSPPVRQANDAPLPTDLPAPVTPPDTETPPPAPPPAALPAQVADIPPAIAPPPASPDPVPDMAVSDTPTPPQAPTVASAITAPPPPDATIDDVVRDAVVPDDSATAPIAQEEQQPTAPQETTSAIVPEDSAPTTSVRPSLRPQRPAPPVETASQASDDTAPAQAPADDIAAALDAAIGGTTDAPNVPTGPPMTGAERDSFRIAVNRCWNVDPGSVAARVTVEVGFGLNPDGTVQGDTIALLSSQGDATAESTAFAAARRAILRCGAGGYDLPFDKYDQWRDVVITFDPSGMRLR